MFLLLLAIQTAAAPAQSRPALETFRLVRAARPDAAEPLAGCVTDCAPDPNRRYRLAVEPVEIEDPRQANFRGVWKECGTSGMPVCPKRGREVLKASFGD